MFREGGIGCGDFAFYRCFPITDVVVIIGVVAAADRGGGELAAGVIAEDVVLHRALAGGVAGGRTTERVVTVLAIGYQGGAAMVRHAGEQVALVLIAERERHVIGFGERLEQVCAGQIGVFCIPP